MFNPLGNVRCAIVSAREVALTQININATTADRTAKLLVNMLERTGKILRIETGANQNRIGEMLRTKESAI